MYFLVDSSQSMAEPTASGQDKWRLVSGALIRFLAAPQNAQIGAGTRGAVAVMLSSDGSASASASAARSAAWNNPGSSAK